MVRPQRVTIRQVARRAGVSIATVSRVFAGSNSVSGSLRQRVLAAAAELDYTPHAIAQSLALGRTKLVGVLVPNLANPYVCGLFRHMSHVAERQGYRLIIADTDENLLAERSMAQSLLQRTDGLVLCTPRSDSEVLTELAGQGKPITVIDRPMDSPRLSTVVVRSDDAVQQLVEHLIELGHRRIAYLRGPERSWQDQERWRAIQEYRSADVTITALCCGGGLGDGTAALDEILGAGCTAVLAFNDMVAFGVLAGATTKGLRVPEDLSVCGFDDVPFARCVSPTLTTASARQKEAAGTTWRLLSGLLNGADPGEHVTLCATPVFRASTARPAATAGA